MHPFLGEIELGGVSRTVGTYGALLAAAIFVTGAMVVRAAGRDRQDLGLVMAALACTVGGGFVGAWLLHAGVEWVRTGTPSASGIVFFGAVPGGALGMLAAGRWLGLDVVRILELSLPGLGVGHALGRLGCFFGGCCYGRPFDGAWAITYSHPFAPGAHPPVPRHPTPLYEAGGLLVLALVFALWPATRPGSGRRAAAYLAGYCALRGLVELTRGDAIRGVWAGVSTSTLAAAVGLAAALGLALAGRRAG
ncbi:MAG: prolipoprotein diacylglyceryl transferase family protein [Myxococcota bacterium]|nr:prolipoprotein diacylglyceryl transferase family protein [Myxococcota bacterium]